MVTNCFRSSNLMRLSLGSQMWFISSATSASDQDLNTSFRPCAAATSTIQHQSASCHYWHDADWSRAILLCFFKFMQPLLRLLTCGHHTRRVSGQIWQHIVSWSSSNNWLWCGWLWWWTQRWSHIRWRGHVSGGVQVKIRLSPHFLRKTRIKSVVNFFVVSFDCCVFCFCFSLLSDSVFHIWNALQSALNSFSAFFWTGLHAAHLHLPQLHT